MSAINPDEIEVEMASPPLAVPPPATPSDYQPLRLDLACGAVCAEGFVGVDIAPCEGVTHVMDLSQPGWDFPDNSVDEARCSHFLEHLTGDEQITFMNELYRILKPGAGAIIITPYGWNDRAWMDPTHKRPIVFSSYLYYNKGWREANKLTHGPYARIVADFDFQSLENPVNPFWGSRSMETKTMASQFFINVVEDLSVLVIKRAPVEEVP